ncbi:MAG: hypothetical protein E7J62_26825 [Serratia marcescens]|uniref:hypothetical protein n=1 Tax=Shewanella xiamenensis TaxID=332186 RepID=UPI000DB0C482|nr:hypothetical protein [Shewanella xiamenensis]MCT8876175.1 hypothetical protein [Shewanella xiamenensis]MDU7808212.1 hypothetical protein [Serratia marcescens]PZP37713.1 MAG: hypothetical protein DI594_02130 [Shewanella oneidensis]
MLRILSLLLLIFSSESLASSWPVPKSIVMVSPDGGVIARLHSGSFPLDKPESAQMSIFTWDEKSGYVLSEHYQLPYRFAPARFAVNDNGFVITVGKYVAEETGPDIGIFNPQGQQIQSYNLEQLFPDATQRQQLIAQSQKLTTEWQQPQRNEPQWYCLSAPDSLMNNAFSVRHELGALLFYVDGNPLERHLFENGCAL